VTKPEFARELPRFVAEVRNLFSGEEIRRYLDHLERMAVIEDEQATDEDNSDFWKDSAEQLAAKRARFAQLRELLTSTVLGTG
jgi:lipase chaperone LimK